MITLLLVIAAIVVAVLLYAATKPRTFSISRSATIQAPPSRIFPLINNLADHPKWSPFAQDPKTRNVVGTPSAGTGARVDFDGNCRGSLSITASQPDSKIVMRLLMTKPMKADNEIEFTFVPQGMATNVTWKMSGPQPYLGKLMSVFIDCEKMCGRQFDQGLANLGRLSEQKSLQAAE
jgi:uncharacterized protein YndB with AHSA1/START domain